MLNFKVKQLSYLAIALFGLAYFTLFSHLEINFFLRGYLAAMLLQAAALIYFAYRHWIGRLP